MAGEACDEARQYHLALRSMCLPLWGIKNDLNGLFEPFLKEELMSDKPWKAYERKISRLFGWQRALQKGTNAKEDIAPKEGIDAAPWIIDCKKRKTLLIWSWMADLVKYADEKGKPPILVFQPWGKRQNYAVVKTRWFLDNFSSHYGLFYETHFTRSDKRTFEEAWKTTTERAGKSMESQYCLLSMYVEKASLAHSDYVCVKLENLISLMKTKNLLEVRENGQD
jgi:hypothetical protein